MATKLVLGSEGFFPTRNNLPCRNFIAGTGFFYFILDDTGKCVPRPREVYNYLESPWQQLAHADMAWLIANEIDAYFNEHPIPDLIRDGFLMVVDR